MKYFTTDFAADTMAAQIVDWQWYGQTFGRRILQQMPILPDGSGDYSGSGRRSGIQKI
jgi:hypothetical protein